VEALAWSESLKLRPLALPTEHGGWGILLEPVALGLLVAPSLAGLMIAVAALLAFLARQPLKLAMQDGLRRRVYPRTSWCCLFAVTYATFASLFFALALAGGGWHVAIPFAAVSPLALVMLLHDARNRSRGAVPEIAGAIAMASIAAAIPIAAGRSLSLAGTMMALILLRSIPSIVFVRALLGRGSKVLSLVLHACAVGIAAVIASPLAVVACVVLFLRALWGVTHAVPRAKTIGWREIAYGAVTVLSFAL
jgi:hypothetical protein